MNFLVNIFNKLFKSRPKAIEEVKHVEIKKVEVYVQNKIYAFGFKSKDHVNYRYFRLKYKILKEGSLKHLALYIDRIDELNKLTNKNWILIVKEKD